MWLVRGSVMLRDARMIKCELFLHGAVMLLSDAG